MTDFVRQEWSQLSKSELPQHVRWEAQFRAVKSCTQSCFLIVIEASARVSRPRAFVRIGGGHLAVHAAASRANRGEPSRGPQIVCYHGTRPTR